MLRPASSSGVYIRMSGAVSTVSSIVNSGAISTMPPMLATATMARARSEEHTSELQSLMRISYAVFCLKKKMKIPTIQHVTHRILIVYKVSTHTHQHNHQI